MTERKITISVVGQSEFTTGYDSDIYVSEYDLERRFTRVEAVLEELGERIVSIADPLPMIREGIISGPEIISTYKIKDCLVDNRIVPTVFDGSRHAVGIAGDEATTQELKNLVEQKIPRHFHPAGRYDKNFSFTVEESFNLNNFNSVEAVYNFLKE